MSHARVFLDVNTKILQESGGFCQTSFSEMRRCLTCFSLSVLSLVEQDLCSFLAGYYDVDIAVGV